MKRVEPKVKIYGFGWAGLCLAHFFNRGGIEPNIYSKTFDGGLMFSSEVEEGVWVDRHGSHILFSKDPAVYSELLSFIQNPISVERKTAISTQDGFTKFPFENGILEKSEEIRMKFYKSMKNATKGGEIKNLKDVFVSLFGDDACQDYFFPYNEKVWKTPIEELSPSIGERIPKPSETYLNNLLSGVFEDGYLHQKYYTLPKNGINELYDGLKHKTRIKGLHYEIDGLNLDKNAISTIPLDSIGKQLGIDTSALRKTGLFCQFAKINKPLPYNWIYEPSSKYSFNRVFSASSDIPVIGFEETTVNGKIKGCPQEIDNWLVDKFGGDIVIEKFYDTSYTDYAYPIQTVESDKVLPKIRDLMPCTLFGRFGNWEYLNMDMIYIKASELVKNFKIEGDTNVVNIG